MSGSRGRWIGLLAVVAALAAGCATAPVIWPGDAYGGARVRYFTLPPEPPMPAEQAIGTIKNLQTRFCTWQGHDISALEVDRFGLRLRATWTETSSGTNYVPSYGGFFVGNSYVPTYGGSYQPWSRTEGREETVVIPFDKVNEVRLVFYGDLNRPNKWGVWFGQEGSNGEGEAVRFLEQRYALEFIAAASALIQAQGKDLSRKGEDGVYWKDLTPAQTQDLAQAGLTAMKVVAFVLKDSPADKAGVWEGDVIRSFEKTPDGKAVVFQILRRAQVPDGKGKGGTVPGWTETGIKVPFWQGTAPSTSAPATGSGAPAPLSRGMIGVNISPVPAPQAAELATQGIAGGTLVGSVSPGGPADVAKVRVGDILLSVDGAPARDDAHFKELIAGAGATVTVRGVRRGQMQDGSAVWMPQSFTITRFGM